jgi:hypothetical protein
MRRLAQDLRRARADARRLHLEHRELVDAAAGAAAPALQARGVSCVQGAGRRVRFRVELLDRAERLGVRQSSAPSEPGARQIVCGSR